MSAPSATRLPGEIPEPRHDKAAPIFKWATNPVRFSSGMKLTSIAVTPRLMIASTQDHDSKLVRLDETGGSSAFAPEFSPPPSALCLVAIAPGFAQFAVDDVFASLGAEVWRYSRQGEPLGLFVQLPEAAGEIGGMCFDTAGGFGRELLLVASGGDVYQVNARGQMRLVGNVGPGGRGPSVLSPRFGKLGGRLLVAFPEQSEVRALAPNGELTVVIRWPAVSGAWAIPDDPCDFAREGGGMLFVATQPDRMFSYSARDVSRYGGGVLLTALRSSGSGLLIPDQRGFSVRAFSRFLGPEQAAAFVCRPAVTEIRLQPRQSFVTPSAASATGALLPLAVLASFDFSPALLDPSTLALAGVAPLLRGRSGLGTSRDVDGDGRPDIVLRFPANELSLHPGANTLTLEGVTLSGESVRGSTIVQVE